MRCAFGMHCAFEVDYDCGCGDAVCCYDCDYDCDRDCCEADCDRSSSICAGSHACSDSWRFGDHGPWHHRHGADCPEDVEDLADVAENVAANDADGCSTTRSQEMMRMQEMMRTQEKMKTPAKRQEKSLSNSTRKKKPSSGG